MGEFHLFWSQWVEFEKDCTTNGVQGFQDPGMEIRGERRWKGGNPVSFSLQWNVLKRSTCWTSCLITQLFNIT